MTSFAEHVDDYLRVRRSFGFKLVEHERLLPRFAAHLDQSRAETVTTELALAWALERDLPAGSVVPAVRLLVARGFARYMIGLDPRTEIPPTDLIRPRRQRRAPFIYSDADIAALMDQARTRIRQQLVAATYETFIGLLAVTGMRTSEAIGLDLADIDWGQGVLLVRESKFNKSRYLPIHDSTIQALRRQFSECVAKAMAAALNVKCTVYPSGDDIDSVDAEFDSGRFGPKNVPLGINRKVEVQLKCTTASA